MSWPAPGEAGTVKHIEDPFRLHPPEAVASVVAFDSETSDLHPDSGAFIGATSVAYRLHDGTLVRGAFPYSQGGWARKGFTPRRLVRGDIRGGMTEAQLAQWAPERSMTDVQKAIFRAWMLDVARVRGLVGHNAQFDVRHFRHIGLELEPLIIWDSMLGQAELDPLEMKGLKETASRIWGAEEADDAAELKDALGLQKAAFGLDKGQGPRYDLVPWSIIGKYAAQDAELTLRLTELQVARLLDGEGSMSAVNRAVRLNRVLMRMERRGFGPYDVETSRAWGERIQARVEQLSASFPDELQPPTPARMSAFYFDQLGLAPWKPGEKPRGYVLKKAGQAGRPRFLRGTAGDREILAANIADYDPTADDKLVMQQGDLSEPVARRLGEEGAPYAADYAEMIRLKTANQMFYANYAKLAGKDGRLRAELRQAQVKTGRLSSSRFNALALPKRVGLTFHDPVTGEEVKPPEPRSLFLPRPGVTRMNLDLSQAELRVGSETARCETMASALREGRDLHGITTSEVFGLDPADGADDRQGTAAYREWKAKRDIAKRLNFGLLFGMGYKTFQAQLWTSAGIEQSSADCKAWCAAWHKLYPEISEANARTEDWVSKRGFVTLWDGTRSYFGRYDYPRTGYNRLVQGGLAAWVGRWLVMVENMTSEWDAFLLAVHDSAVLDLPEDRALEISMHIKRESEAFWLNSFGFPGKVDVEKWAK